MGRTPKSQSGQQTGLTASCPRCGETFAASSIQLLAKKVGGCMCLPLAAATLPHLPATFRLEKMIETQNKTTYSHWSVYQKDKKAWIQAVRSACAGLFGLRLPWSRWSIRRVYAGRHREMDFANLVGGAKPLVDCLVSHKIIVDDKPSCFDGQYSQTRGDGSYTLLTLESTCQNRT